MNFAAFNSSAGARLPRGVEGNLILQHGGACLSSLSIISWSKGCLALYAPAVTFSKVALPSKTEGCVCHSEMDTHLLLPVVLCTEGSLVSAAIYLSGETCPTLHIRPLLHLSDISSISCEMKSQPSSPPWLMLGWISWRWRTVRGPGASAEGHTLNNTSSEH